MADGVAITAGSGTTILTDDTGAGGHAQVVKLAISTDGSGTLIPADGTNGLMVNLAANNDVTVTGTVTANLAAGTNNIGDVDILSIAAGDNNIGNVDIVTVPAPLSTTGGGTEATAQRVTIANDSTGLLPVVANRDQLTIDVTSGGLTTATTAYVAGDQVGTIFTLASAAKTSGGTGAVTGVRLMDETDIIGPYDVVFFDSSVTLASDNAAFAISDGDAAKVIGLVQLGGAYDIGNNRIAQAFNLAIPYTLSGSSNLYAALITRAGHTFFGAVTSLKLRVMVERYS